MRSTRLSGLSFLLFALSAPVLAQGPVANLSGEVRDPSGASVPSVAVTARETDTNVSRSTVTNQAGIYNFVGLPPGHYELTAEAPGFRREVRNDLVLQVAQDARIDINLQLGAASDVVNVTEQAPVTETESAATGTVIDNTKVVELPLNGRQFYNLALLIPGANLAAENSTTGYRGGFNISGRAETENNFTVNGIDNNDQSVNAPSVRPSVDDIQEFRLMTGIYPAEYGRSMGGQVVVITKSGSNSVHGTLFEFLRNQAVDAANFFTQAGAKPAYRRNNFGATIGGPIVKNKTFFHFSYEGLRLVQQVAATGTVPTAAMDTGNFSTLLTAAKPIQLKYPGTSTPIPGDIIPASLISPVGQSLLEQYPAASVPTLAGAPANNYFLNGNQTEDMNEYSTRIDHTFSSKDSLTFHYMYFGDPVYYVFNSLCGSSVMPNGGCFTGWTGQLGGFSEVHIFSPTLINEARLGVNRMRQPRVQTDVNVNFWGPFNTPNVGPATADNTGIPYTSISGYSRLGGPSNLPQNRWDTTYTYMDTLTWTKGTHSFKFGAEYRPFDSNFQFVSYGRGGLTFNASSTAPTTGYALADALMGYPTQTNNNNLAPPIYGRTKGTYAFAQDDWKMTRNFTVNAGLRWEYNSPYVDAQNRSSTIDLVTGQLDVQGQPGFTPSIYKSSWKKFGPRLGFAWQPFGDSKTVIRAGSGVFFDNTITFNGLPFVTSNPPYRNPQTYLSSLTNPLTLANPFPVGPGSSILSVSGIQNNYTTPSVYEWVFDVQRQIPFDILVDVSYFGSRGVHLPLEINPNEPLPSALNTTSTLQQAARPYPTWANMTFLESGNVSTYNSLQIKVEKHASKNLGFLLSETYARSIDAGAQAGSTSNSSSVIPQNSYDWKGEMGLSDYNVKSRTVFSIVGLLPFGKGQKWVRDGFASYLVGGWQLSSITTFETGRPWTPKFTGNISNTNQLDDRPNYVAGCNPYAGFETVQQWVNPACFTTPAQGTFGDLGRNVLIGPKLFDLDFAVDRNFTITERIHLQFRGELFNILNHPDFNLPTTQYDNPSFGSLTSAMDPREIQFGLKVIY
ncbi:MAG TPA: carboxypeptidase regulatory-like domain-containing protein [Bryobacteraceae bacterium]|nr:carboxypeptidase regulatory-like domain-containing protein [Bryobacteraceae bacterium]